MTYLLDTHVLLWAIGRSTRLSAPAREIIEDSRNRVLVSTVSLWEASLKYGLGKLKLEPLVPDEIPDHCRRLGFEILPLESGDAASYHVLPRVDAHRDPFDRMLVHQCIRGNLILVSRDGRMRSYGFHGLRQVW